MPDSIPQDDDRPKADPTLTRRFEALDRALNGLRRATRSRNLNWSGLNKNTVTLETLIVGVVVVALGGLIFVIPALRRRRA